MSEYRVIEGDCLDVLATLDAGSVQTCITSPPYYGLRDYGTTTWDGGDPECDHTPRARSRQERPANGLTGGKATVDAGTVQRGDCHCGATRIDPQIGLEETPEQYIANLVAVFREVRRVLRDDGTLWLNLGDTYYSPIATQGRNENRSAVSTLADHGPNGRSPALDVQTSTTYRRDIPGLKPKDLLGIPWMVAFALRADGWYLRSDIIWAKANPMPESVTDRPTKAHEYLFLLTKSARYYFDANAIREAWADERNGASGAKPAGYDNPSTLRSDGGFTRSPQVSGRNKRSVWDVPEDVWAQFLSWLDEQPAGSKPDVWRTASQPFPGAHFATFPPKLIEPCVLAGSRAGDTVLDPFNGAGTTGMVALRNDRDYVGIELNSEYAQMARDRIYDDGPLLNVEAA